MEKEFLLLIDGSSLLSTQYYGNLPREVMFAKTTEEKEKFYYKIMQNSSGVYTNAVYGFMRTLLKILKDQKPTHLAVAWDLTRNTFRREIDPDYKGTRGETPQPLKEQFALCQNLLKKMNIVQLMDENYEADDFCGSAALKFENEIPVRIVTKDNDYLQLVTDKTKLWLMFTTQEKADELFKKYEINKTLANVPDKTFELDPELVKKEFGVRPDQIADLKALIGDKSDNIRGVSGVGEASAVPLINKYENIENLYDAIKDLDKNQEKEIKALWKTELGIKRSPLSYLLKTSDDEIVGKKAAEISKKLAIIKKDIDLGLNLEDFKLDINADEASKEFRKLEFKSLNLNDVFDEIQRSGENTEAADMEVISVDNMQQFFETASEFKERIYIGYSLKNEKEFTTLFADKIFIAFQSVCYAVDFEKLYEEDKDGALDILKGFMENKDIKKVIHDGKNLLTFLSRNGIKTEGFDFDTAIAAYLIDSAQTEYTIEDLIEDYLHESIQSIKTAPLGTAETYIPRIYEILKEKIKKQDMETLYYDVEHPLIHVLSSMEETGFNINLSILDELKVKFSGELENVQKEIYELADEEFNVGSPKQLGKILFEKLDLPVVKKTKTGYSTNQEVLEVLEDKHPIIPKIMYYRQISKINSTYVEGLKNFVESDGRIHSKFNQTVTTTGRLSSTDPNLQNIPVRNELGKEIRKAFVPLEEGDILLSCDYSQIELRVLAHMADDANMIDAFKHHSDIHTKTASEVFGTDMKDVTPEMRRNAKAVNFGIVYGIGAFRLSKDLNITKTQAQNYMDKYFERYPNIKKYLEDVIKDAELDGYVLTILNRKRYIPEVNSSNKRIKALGERLAMNAPIQGSAADIIKIAMINVYNRLKKEKLKSQLLLQVHDELILNVKKEELEKVKKLVKEEMENAANLKVDLDVDINTGATWYDAK